MAKEIIEQEIAETGGYSMEDEVLTEFMQWYDSFYGDSIYDDKCVYFWDGWRNGWAAATNAMAASALARDVRAANGE